MEIYFGYCPIVTMNLEDFKILHPNFSGTPSKLNTLGRRTFAIRINEKESDENENSNLDILTDPDLGLIYKQNDKGVYFPVSVGTSGFNISNILIGSADDDSVDFYSRIDSVEKYKFLDELFTHDFDSDIGLQVSWNPEIIITEIEDIRIRLDIRSLGLANMRTGDFHLKRMDIIVKTRFRK